MLPAEGGGSGEGLGCAIRLVLAEVREAQVQKYIPTLETEVRGGEVFGEFFGGAAHHAGGETQMVVGQRVIGLRLEQLAVQDDGRRVVLTPERKVRIQVADLSVREGQ